MVPIEKIEELGAVANFWKARIGGLRAELAMLQDMKADGRIVGVRYATDRLLREIKKKTAETAEAERSLRVVERELGLASEVASHLIHAGAPAGSARSTH